MTRPIIIVDSAVLPARDHLRQHLPLVELGELVAVGTKEPTVDFPYIRVSSDGGLRTSGLLLRDELRVNVWHPDEGLCAELAALAEAIILAGPWPDGVRSINPRSRATSPIPDTDTGAYLATFGVTAAPTPRLL